MESHKFWLENLRQYETMTDLRRSDFFARCGSEIEQFLKTPHVYSLPGATPRFKSFLRVVQWNIEKGKRFDEILNRLKTNEVLKWADVIILNEADWGMNRSQNRHVALALGERLGMNVAFGPAHFELTKGIDDERALPGENCESLQGNAVLSRYPILEARTVPLPASFEPYESEEKRFGWRSCLWVRLRLERWVLWVGSVHLELRNTPKCRALQMTHVMKHLPGGENEPHLLGGDLNTNGFARGTPLRTIKSVLQLLFTPTPRMKHKLLHPELEREPLFRVLGDHGFHWGSFNSDEETACAAISSLEEAGFLPDLLLRAFKGRLEPYHGCLCFKLDWLLGKNVCALTAGQKRDHCAEAASVGPGCLNGENTGSDRLSDHLPIYADLDLA